MLAELDREDFLTLGADGKIRAAYPFSADQAPHRVRITGGAEVWSMCAIDALGIPAMLGRGVVITSGDPVTGEPVTVTAGPDRATVWQPGGTVVYIGSRSCSGPAATVCCDALNFFTCAASARTWAREHAPARQRAPQRDGGRVLDGLWAMHDARQRLPPGPVRCRRLPAPDAADHRGSPECGAAVPVPCQW